MVFDVVESQGEHAVPAMSVEETDRSTVSARTVSEKEPGLQGLSRSGRWARTSVPWLGTPAGLSAPQKR